jgi:hypothetical protein
LLRPKVNEIINCNPRIQDCSKQPIDEKNEGFDPNFECEIAPKLKLRPEHSHLQQLFSIFNLDVPLGEILYEENEKDDYLKNINKNPEFICFVNKA